MGKKEETLNGGEIKTYARRILTEFGDPTWVELKVDSSCNTTITGNYGKLYTIKAWRESLNSPDSNMVKALKIMIGHEIGHRVINGAFNNEIGRAHV